MFGRSSILRTLLTILGLDLAALVAGCVPPSTGPITLTDLQGVWISQATLEQLKLTKSPKDAVHEMCYLEIDSVGIHWGIHEAGGFSVSRLQPTQIVNQYEVYDTNNEHPYHLLSINSANFPSILRLSYKSPYTDSTTIITFVRTHDSLQRLCNKFSVAGTYFDSTGKQYVFNDNGLAIWPAKQFRYDVNLDFTFDDPNTIINWNEFDSTDMKWVGYGFDHRHDRLLLYNQHSSENSAKAVNEDNPFLVLLRK